MSGSMYNLNYLLCLRPEFQLLPAGKYQSRAGQSFALSAGKKRASCTMCFSSSYAWRHLFAFFLYRCCSLTMIAMAVGKDQIKHIDVKTILLKRLQEIIQAIFPQFVSYMPGINKNYLFPVVNISIAIVASPRQG